MPVQGNFHDMFTLWRKQKSVLQASSYKHDNASIHLTEKNNFVSCSENTVPTLKRGLWKGSVSPGQSFSPTLIGTS